MGVAAALHLADHPVIEQRFRKGEGKPEGDHKAAILQRRSKRRVVYRVLILVTLLGNVAFNIWFFYIK